MFGLFLVAGSIGFNTLRYPIVWQMVGTTLQAAPAETPAKPREEVNDLKSPPAANSTPAPVSPAQPAEIKPVPDVTERIPANDLPAIPTYLEEATESSHGPASAERPTEPRGSLIPVSRGVDGAETSGNTEFAASVRRLPKVEDTSNAAWPPNADAAYGRTPTDAPLPSQGGCPIYPSTGLQ